MRNSAFQRGGNPMSQLHFVKQGRGQVVVLSHARGCDLSMWDEVAQLLENRYTVLRYDHRGHGSSPEMPGAYTIDALADDAAAFIEEHAGTPVHFVGLSMGGIVAQSLAVRYPQWVRSLVIANATSHFTEADRALWAQRMTVLQEHGMSGIADQVLPRWFTPQFLATPQGAARAQQVLSVFTRTPLQSYLNCCDAMANINYIENNHRIACPTLVIAGLQDVATPPAMSNAIVLAISGAELQTLDTAHMSAVEQPLAFVTLVKKFIKSV
jgi:3-oxoadipate enol-lactonase